MLSKQNKNTIGQIIREERHKQNMSLTELASRVGITKQSLYKYETGIITNIPLNNIEKISTVLGCSPAYLMGWHDVPTEKANTTEKPAILKKYDKLNSLGRCKVDAYIDGILENPDYLKEFDHNDNYRIAAFGGIKEDDANCTT